MTEGKHYEQRLENKCNLKGSWRVLKDIIHKKKSVSSCSHFFVNNKITSDQQVVPNGFNSFFPLVKSITFKATNLVWCFAVIYI